MVSSNVRVSDHFRLLRPLAVLIAGVGLAVLALTLSLADEPISKYERKSPAGADSVIVFVHGIRGDGITSWTNKNVYWPELLTHDHSFDGSDIFVYSYPTGPWATLAIDELADNMRSVLDVNGVSKYSKIIFLSHSMGGVLTRAYLLRYRDIADKTAFAYFFATPTTGSEAASVLRWALKNPQIEELRSMNPEDYLANLMRQWLDANFSFPSYCAYERKPTDGVVFVDMGSAAALCTRGLDPIDADHIEIVKPEDQNSPSYVAFKKAYMAVEAELAQQMTRSQATAPPSDSLINNTGTISTNRVTNSIIINGRPEQLTIIANNGKINNNTINDNFVDGNVSLLNNAGTINSNEIERNTIMRSTHSSSGDNEKSARPFRVAGDSLPVRDRDGAFTCSFRIQMESQAKVDHLIVALGADGLLGFNIISDQPAVRLNPFVGYIIAKVINPSGVLRVLGRYSKAGCNHEINISSG
jgi:pimeloyl-ACP methyl ester carboxylesterase